MIFAASHNASHHATQTQSLHYAMSPTGVVVLLLLALVIDYMSIGINSVRDRVAFFLALPAIYVGFSGGPLEKWTIGMLSQLIDGLKQSAGGLYIAGVATETLIAAGIGILTIYTIGVLLPEKASTSLKLGGFAKLKWKSPDGKRLNSSLWFAAIALGLFADLPSGIVGSFLRSCIQLTEGLVAPLPNLLFGAN